MKKQIKKNKKIIDENPEMMKVIKQISERGIVELPDVTPINGPVELDWSLFSKIKNSKQK